MPSPDPAPLEPAAAHRPPDEVLDLLYRSGEPRDLGATARQWHDLVATAPEGFRAGQWMARAIPLAGSICSGSCGCEPGGLSARAGRAFTRRGPGRSPVPARGMLLDDALRALPPGRVNYRPGSKEMRKVERGWAPRLWTGGYARRCKSSGSTRSSTLPGPGTWPAVRSGRSATCRMRKRAGA